MTDKEETKGFRGPASLPSGARLDKLIHTGFFCPREYNNDDELEWGALLYFQGPPGATKTTKLSRFTRGLISRSGARIPFEGMKPGARGEGQFGVVPVPCDITVNGKTVRVLDYPPPRFMVEKFADGVGLVLIDELTTAPPSIQPALLGFSHEKELGTYRMGPRVRIFSAGNAVAESANGYEIAMPQANRFVHLPWPDPSNLEVGSYMVKGISLEPVTPLVIEDEEERVMHEWGPTYPQLAGSLAGFLHARPSLVRNQPPGDYPQASGAWASPRTWMYAAQLLTAAKIHSCNEVETDLLVGGALGAGVYRELSAYRRELNLPDPIAILAGQEFQHNPMRLDVTFAVLTGCAAVVCPNNNKERAEQAERLWRILTQVSKAGAKDVCYPVAQQLMAAKLFSQAGLELLDEMRILASLIASTEKR